MAKDGLLNMPVLLETMRRINSTWAKEETTIIDYSQIYIMWTGVMAHFGPALVVAFKDAREKASDFVNNRDVFVN